MRRLSFVSSLLFGLCCLAAAASGQELGLFEHQSDVGELSHPGTARYDAAAGRYTLSGGGENMWAAKDDFHFVWKRVDTAGDLTLAATIAILGDEAGADGHRKAVLMFRQDLDADSVYVDAARHGEGLTSLQFRPEKGGITREIEANVSEPARLRLEKQGDDFYLWVANEAGKPMEFAGGSAHVLLRAPFYVGIGVCAHKKDRTESAAFTDVELRTGVAHPKASYSTVETVMLSGDARSGYVAREQLVAPGWSADGRSLTYSVAGDEAKKETVPFTPLRTAAPVGPALTPMAEPGDVYSAKAGVDGVMQIWRKPAAGEGEAVTSAEYNSVSPHLSPDGKYLLFLTYARDLKSLPARGEVSLRVLTLADKKLRLLGTFVGGAESLGTQPWSPDGRRIVFVSYQRME